MRPRKIRPEPASKLTVDTVPFVAKDEEDDDEEKGGAAFGGAAGTGAAPPLVPWATSVRDVWGIGGGARPPLLGDVAAAVGAAQQPQ